MTGSKQEAEMMLGSNYLLQAHDYSIRTAVQAKNVRTTSMAIFETGAGTV